MSDIISTMSGVFKIEFISADNEVDCYEDANMIMTGASSAMANIFSNTNVWSTYQINAGLSTAVPALGTAAPVQAPASVDCIRIGTLGHIPATATVPASLLNPKKANSDGYVNTRNRMFSEFTSVTLLQPPVTVPPTIPAPTANVVLPTLHLNDVLHVNSPTIANTGYYRFKGGTSSLNATLNGTVDPTVIPFVIPTYILNDATLTDIVEWEFLGIVQPYVYELNFEIPEHLPAVTSTRHIYEGIKNGAQNLSATSFATVVRTGTSVSFGLEFSTTAANGQNNNFSNLTEAALYSGGEIFALKTFKNKVKDNTVSIRITWKILF